MTAVGLASDLLYALAIVLVGSFSTARLTRLITQDSYPPAAWLRIKWENFTLAEGKQGRHGWASLITCPYCAAPYIVAAIGLWGWLTDWQTAWWVFNIWLAVSYIASMIVVRDGE